MGQSESGSFRLYGTTKRLSVLQSIRVADHCETLSYQYALWRTKDKASWLIRWEYYRQRPRAGYEYPLAHLHVNAEFDEVGQALPQLHVPTARVSLELVVWHLIVEWGAKPKSDDWQQILEESIEGFEERRQAH